jgi:cytochrome c553
LIAISSAANAQMMNGGMGMKNGTTDQQQPSSSQASANASASHHNGYAETQTFCTGCHQPPTPSQHTANEWPQVIERMQKYMQKQRRRLPNSSEIKLVLEYLDDSKASH